MKVQQIIGADLSKKTIDLVSHLHNNHLQIENCLFGFKQMLRWLVQRIPPSKYSQKQLYSYIIR